MKRSNPPSTYVTLVAIFAIYIFFFVGCRSNNVGLRYITEDGWDKYSKTYYHIWIPTGYSLYHYDLCKNHPVIRSYSKQIEDTVRFLSEVQFGSEVEYGCSVAALIEFINPWYLDTSYNDRWDGLIPNICWQVSENADSCLQFKNQIIGLLTYYSSANFNDRTNSNIDSKLLELRQKFEIQNFNLTFHGIHRRYDVLWVFHNRSVLCFASDKRAVQIHSKMQQSIRSLRWRETIDTGYTTIPKD